MSALDNPDVFLTLMAGIFLLAIGLLLRSLINWASWVPTAFVLMIAAWFGYELTQRFDPLPDYDRMMVAGMTVWSMVF